MRPARRNTAWFTLLVMSWASIWCCCVAPARSSIAMESATNDAPPARPARRSCCDPVPVTATASLATGPARPSACSMMPGSREPSPGSPARPEGCPIVQAREARLAPVAIVLPTHELNALPLPTWLVPSLIVVPAVRGKVLATAAPPPRPPTLLDLHTSLVC